MIQRKGGSDKENNVGGEASWEVVEW
jgi:hypothetical protein